MTFHAVHPFSKASDAVPERVFPKEAMSRELLPAAALSKPSSLRWLLALFMDYGVVILAMAVAHSAFVVAQQKNFDAVSSIIAFLVIVLAIVAIGTRQHAILVLAHDGSHGHVSRNPRWNDLLTNLLSLWPFGVGLSGYRKFHFAHHRYMGTSSDPEFIQKKKAAPTYDLPASPARILGSAITALFGEGSTDQINFIKYLIARNSLRDIVAPIVTWMAVSLVLWHFNAWWIALLWFVALSTSFGAVFRLRVWTEHMGTPGVHRVSTGLFCRLIFLPHHTWCHFEHHRFPSVPSWNLTKARALDIETPIHTVKSLFASYADCSVIPSGNVSSPGIQALQRYRRDKRARNRIAKPLLGAEMTAVLRAGTRAAAYVGASATAAPV